MIKNASPIFIIGSMRSGGSILKWSLAQHPSIRPVLGSRWLTGYARCLHDCYAQAVEHRAESYLDIMGVEIEDFCVHFGNAINSLMLFPKESMLEGRAATGSMTSSRDSQVQARRWIDESPEFCSNVFALLRLFPDAKFIHVVRDAKEVVASLTDPERRSIYRSHYREMSEEAAYEHWLTSVRACLEAEQAFGSDTVLRVRRDDLVNDPESTLRHCLSFLGEPFSEACLRPFRR